jgi:hypothetical protein
MKVILKKIIVWESIVGFLYWYLVLKDFLCINIVNSSVKDDIVRFTSRKRLDFVNESYSDHESSCSPNFLGNERSSCVFNINLLFDWKILQFFNFLLDRFDINDLFINFGYFMHWIILLPNNLSRDILNNCFLLIINDSFRFGTHLGICSSFVIYNLFLVRYVWDSALAYESLYLITLYKLALSELWPSQPSDIFRAQPFALGSLALSQCGSVSVFVRCWI